MALLFNMMSKEIPPRSSYECLCSSEVESISEELIRGPTELSTGSPAVYDLC